MSRICFKKTYKEKDIFLEISFNFSSYVKLIPINMDVQFIYVKKNNSNIAMV